MIEELRKRILKDEPRLKAIGWLDTVNVLVNAIEAFESEREKADGTEAGQDRLKGYEQAIYWKREYDKMTDDFKEAHRKIERMKSVLNDDALLADEVSGGW